MTSLIELLALCGIGTAWTGIRLFSCVKNSIKQDVLAFIGWALFVVEIVLVYVADDAATTENEGTTSTTHPTEHDMRLLDSRIQVAVWIVHSFLLLFLKLSVLCLFLHLSESQNARPITKGGFIVAGVAVVASVLSILFGCRPFYRYWQVGPEPENSCQAAVSRPIIFTSLSSTVVTELYLLMIPVKLLWRTEIRLKDKITVMATLNAGIFVLVCSAIKTYYISAASNAHDGAHVAGAWRVREAFIAVVTTSLPQVFRRLKIWTRLLSDKSHPPSIRTQVADLETIGRGGTRPDQRGSQWSMKMTAASISNGSTIPGESPGQPSEAC